MILYWIAKHCITTWAEQPHSIIFLGFSTTFPFEGYCIFDVCLLFEVHLHCEGLIPFEDRLPLNIFFHPIFLCYFQFEDHLPFEGSLPSFQFKTVFHKSHFQVRAGLSLAMLHYIPQNHNCTRMLVWSDIWRGVIFQLLPALAGFVLNHYGVRSAISESAQRG